MFTCWLRGAAAVSKNLIFLSSYPCNLVSKTSNISDYELTFNIWKFKIAKFYIFFVSANSSDPPCKDDNACNLKRVTWNYACSLFKQFCFVFNLQSWNINIAPLDQRFCWGTYILRVVSSSLLFLAALYQTCLYINCLKLGILN